MEATEHRSRSINSFGVLVEILAPVHRICIGDEPILAGPEVVRCDSGSIEERKEVLGWRPK